MSFVQRGGSKPLRLIHPYSFNSLPLTQKKAASSLANLGIKLRQRSTVWLKQTISHTFVISRANIRTSLQRPPRIQLCRPLLALAASGRATPTPSPPICGETPVHPENLVDKDEGETLDTKAGCLTSCFRQIPSIQCRIAGRMHPLSLPVRSTSLFYHTAGWVDYINICCDLPGGSRSL